MPMIHLEEKLGEILANLELLKLSGTVSIETEAAAEETEPEVVEVRILKTQWGTISGYYTDYKKLAMDIDEYIGENDIYVTLNPVKKDLLARCSNRLEKYAKHTTSDNDIDRIKYVMIDFDPVRPAGISSTDDEKKKAAELLKQVRKSLLDLGYPEPIVADSGNGYHLLLPTDFENNKENVALVKEFLSALDFLYSNEKVHVDKTTYNPARIGKLYGTTACKGDDTEDRPHRDSKLLKFPEKLIPVTVEQLQVVIDKKPKVKKPIFKSGISLKTDVEAFIEEHRLDLNHSKPYEDGTIYVLGTCPWNSVHTDNSAYIMQFGNGAVAAGCHHDSCSEENWKSLRVKLGVAEEKAETEKPESKEKLADVLLKFVSKFDYYTDDLEEPYMTVKVKGKDTVMKIMSNNFRSYLRYIYEEETGLSIGSDAISQAVETLKAKAVFSGNQKKLERRAAFHNGCHYYDLGSTDGAVEINESGVKLLPQAPSIFKRGKNMKEQLKPDLSVKPQELIKLVKKHFRVKKELDAILLAIYIVTAFIRDIAHVIMVLHGEKGAAKSTSMKMLKSIIDPAAQALLTMPRAKQDLIVTLSNNYMSCFDNLDSLSAEKSDLLCMAATGGAVSTRTLYSNDDETVLEFKVLVALNGINIVANRADLLDRSILIELDRIPKTERKTEAEIWEDFNADIPKFLGAIMNTVSKAIPLREELKLDEAGRMADFTYWGYAAAEAMGIGGQYFLDAYLSNQSSANDEAIESNPVASSVVALMKENTTWTGSVSELLEKLRKVAIINNIDIRAKVWPTSPSILSKRLKEVKSNLQEIDIEYDIKKKSNFKQITIEYKGEDINSLKVPLSLELEDEEISVEEYFVYKNF